MTAQIFSLVSTCLRACIYICLQFMCAPSPSPAIAAKSKRVLFWIFKWNVSWFSTVRWRDDAEATAVQSLLSKLFLSFFLSVFFRGLRCYE